MEEDIHSFNMSYGIMILPHWLQSKEGRKLLQKSPLLLGVERRRESLLVRKESEVNSDRSRYAKIE